MTGYPDCIDGDRAVCSMCRKEIDVRASICPYCQIALEPKLHHDIQSFLVCAMVFFLVGCALYGRFCV